MAQAPISTQVRINNIVTQLSSPGTAFENPPIYLWSVFFKIDGNTAQIVPTGLTSGSLHGTATVVSTPGDQGDLPGGVQATFGVNETTPIPSSLGDYSTTLAPFPVAGVSGLTYGGMSVGWLGILLYQNNTPADDVAAGHQALNSAVLQALNSVIPTVTSPAALTPARLAGFANQIQAQVTAAIANALSIWNKLGILLNDEYPDVFVGNAVQLFNSTQLQSSPPQGITINAPIVWGGKEDPNLYTFTFNGSVLANWPPFSLRRVLEGLGYALPASMRSIMGTFGSPSVLAWIEAVT
jgi:hypothetical protein